MREEVAEISVWRSGNPKEALCEDVVAEAEMYAMARMNEMKSMLVELGSTQAPPPKNKAARTTTAVAIRVVSSNRRAPTQRVGNTCKLRPHASPAQRGLLAWRRAPEVALLLSCRVGPWKGK